MSSNPFNYSDYNYYISLKKLTNAKLNPNGNKSRIEETRITKCVLLITSCQQCYVST